MNTKLTKKRCGQLAMGLALTFSLISFTVACDGGDKTNDLVPAALAASLLEGEQKATLSYEEFLTLVYKEPGENGVYIVNGDTPVQDESELRAFYQQYVSGNGALGVVNGKSTVYNVDGQDIIWDETQRKNLTYCISNDFGIFKGAMVVAMAQATFAWEQASGYKVNFKYHFWQDGNCDTDNTNVVFNVSEQFPGIPATAKAFFPNFPRNKRSLTLNTDLILYNLAPYPIEGLSPVAGVLRHELGHVLGLRHEHTRPEAGKCFEDNEWRPLTEYDSESVMHYAECNGTAGYKYNLSEKDKEGIRSIYAD